MTKKEIMKLEHQCCPLEQAKKLKELLVMQESFFAWSVFGNTHLCVHNPEFDALFYDSRSAAFTSSELGIMLPCDNETFDINTYYNTQTLEWVCAILKRDDEDSELEYSWLYDGCGETEAEARANALIWLIEDGLITTDDVNNRLLQSDQDVQVSDTNEQTEK